MNYIKWYSFSNFILNHIKINSIWALINIPFFITLYALFIQKQPYISLIIIFIVGLFLVFNPSTLVLFNIIHQEKLSEEMSLLEWFRLIISRFKKMFKYSFSNWFFVVLIPIIILYYNVNQINNFISPIYLDLLSIITYFLLYYSYFCMVSYDKLSIPSLLKKAIQLLLSLNTVIHMLSIIVLFLFFTRFPLVFFLGGFCFYLSLSFILQPNLKVDVPSNNDK